VNKDTIPIHVRKARNEAKFWLVPEIELARNKRFRPHELSQIERIIQEYHDKLIEEWHAYFGKQGNG